MHIIDILPIKWFGDKDAYLKSEIRIITVGLNPSDKEFRNKDEELSSALRFPSYNGTEPSLTIALNEYFEKRPYDGWFKAFEHILKGLNASYYANSKMPNRALHTDFCSPWATIPTWSKLKSKEKKQLLEKGYEEWTQLVSELQPNIILFSIPQEYIDVLFRGQEPNLEEFCCFTKTKDGKNRKLPVQIKYTTRNGSLLIFGRTRNVPLGSLGMEQKYDLGEKILTFYEKGRL